MLALKKKREAEAAAAASASATTDILGTSDGNSVRNAVEDPSEAGGSTKVSLIGAIGGKKTKDKVADAGKEGSSVGKKRTPGEIRIQKGMAFDRSCPIGAFTFKLDATIQTCCSIQTLPNWMGARWRRLNSPIPMT
jgi:hypothetical protein